MQPTSLSPVQFGRKVLGYEFYEWQKEALLSVAHRAATTLVAANESGKTTHVIGPLVLWFLARYCVTPPLGRIVCTSGSWTQLKSQLVPAIRAQRHKLPDFRFLATDGISLRGLDGDDRVATFFSTADPGRAEGAHSLDLEEAPLLVIVDEAKSVPDAIYKALDRTNPAMQLYTSSAGLASGRFFRSFNEERGEYHQIKVTSYDCPHIAQETIEKDFRIYGEWDPFVRSKHFSEFEGAVGDVVLSEDDLRGCLEDPPLWTSGSKVVGLDFAAGGDKNVIAVRHGNRCWFEKIWRQTDTVAASREFLRVLRRLGVSASQTFADGGGLGTVMLDVIEDEARKEGAPFRIHRVYNNSPAEKNERYADRGAEMWFEAARDIRNHKVILEDDPAFFREATTRRAVERNRKLAVESKDDMKERGLPSPDLADAMFMAITCGPHLGGALSREHVEGSVLGTRGVRTRTPI